MITKTSPRRAAIAAIALGLAACVLVPATVSAAEAAKRDRVVMQVSDNDPAKWNLALNNANNLQQALGAEERRHRDRRLRPRHQHVQVRISGRQPDRRRLEGRRQVRSLREHDARGKLTKADMLDTVGFVPGGVIEIMRREQEGWAYIRP